MNQTSHRMRVLWIAVALLPLAARAAVADEDSLLDYCLANPEACAMSVEALDEGWEGHLNADRPQALASTFKALVVLAYAQAVADGVVSPDDTVDKDEWARYFSGGASLATTWELMGNPDRVRLGDLARLMVVNGDNSAADFFLAALKKKVIKKAVRRFDWHDFPAGISAQFGLWLNLNGVGGTGNRVAADYGGFEAAGYQKELKQHTKALDRDTFVDAVREQLCDQPPWLAGPPPCDPAQPFTTEKSFKTLTNRHFTRGTTRAYATLMRKLLTRSLLSPDAQEILEQNLEAWLDVFPSLRSDYLRYGLKGGNLPTAKGDQILTWAHYLETPAGRFVVVIFLRDMLATRRAPIAQDFQDFVFAFTLDSSFRRRVREALEGPALPPELVPQLVRVKAKGRKLTVKAKVSNTSPLSSGVPVEVSLYLLDDIETEGATPLAVVEVGALAGYKSKTVTLTAKADEDVAGKLAVLRVDSDDALAEQDEDNNLTWERLE